MRQIDPRCRASRGFTLIEVIAAVAILAAAAVTLTWAIASGQASALDARQRIEASIALDEVTSGILLGTSYSNLPTLIGYPHPASVGLCWFDISPEQTTIIAGAPISGRLVHLRIETMDGRLLGETEYFYHKP